MTTIATKTTSACRPPKKRMTEKIEKRGLKHGMRYHPAYTKWVGIKTRCDNPNNEFYSSYGGRGITYTPAWRTFGGFWKDMESGYERGLEIDRINNNDSYSKENCKWSTRKEQQNNRRSCKTLSFEGKQLNITQWAELLKVNRQTIYSRIRRGWTVEEVLGVMIQTHQKETL
jgi:hypothetical protein